MACTQTDYGKALQPVTDPPPSLSKQLIRSAYHRTISSLKFRRRGHFDFLALPQDIRLLIYDRYFAIDTDPALAVAKLTVGCNPDRYIIGTRDNLAEFFSRERLCFIGRMASVNLMFACKRVYEEAMRVYRHPHGMDYVRIEIARRYMHAGDKHRGLPFSGWVVWWPKSEQMRAPSSCFAGVV
ncbi:hypothetical protein LTR50_001554 [Elasticomyces elasticus]|nr:hypothetical protein LTR50_001554 [Elasticomyces elasticus]